MAELTAIQKTLLENIADLHEIPAGAYNIRSNGGMLGRNTTANIDIVTKTDKPGIDIIIKRGQRTRAFIFPFSSHRRDLRKWFITSSLSERTVMS